MSDGTAKTWQQAKLLNAFYKAVGEAAIGKGACPQFSVFKAGYDPSLEGPETEDGIPTVNDIAMKASEVPNEFYKGLVNGEFSDDTALILCEIPQGAVSEPTKFNFIGLFDEDGEVMLAAAATLTDWLTPTETDRSYLAISFPMDIE